MHISEFNGKKVLLLGFGAEGSATYEFLKKKVPNIHIGIADAKTVQELPQEIQKIVGTGLDLSHHFGPDYLDHFHEYDIVIKTPGISFLLPQVQRTLEKGVRFTSATEIFFAEAQGEIIGITGSKGKSTTAAILYEILRTGIQHFEPLLIGNIGKPALKYLENDHKNRIYVYELSSYQLENVRCVSKIGLITSFFPAHLDHHGNEEEYFQAKMNLFRFMKEKNIAIYNPKYRKIAAFLEEINCTKKLFNDGVFSTIQEEYLIHNGEKIMPVAHVPLLGRHNLENLLGAISVAKQYGVSHEVIDEAVSNFQSLEHRLEPVGEFRNIRFYNDSQSSTPNSTIAAIAALGDALETIILGGLDTGFEFAELGEAVAASRIENVILFPDTGEKIWEEIVKACQKKKQEPPNHVSSTDMKDAVRKCYERTKSGKICVLSPGCQSYNMFTRLEERGEQFKEFVKKLA